MLIKRWLRMEQAGGDGAAAGSAEGGVSEGGAEADGQAGAAASTEGSLLDALAAGQGAAEGEAGADETGKAGETPEARALKAAEKDTRRPKDVPAKFWDAENGEVKFDAWAKSTKELETRMKDVGLPPESPDGYKFEVPAAFKQAGVELDPDQFNGFRNFAHKAGMSQKQFDAAMGELYANVETMVQMGERLDKAQTMQALTEHYKTPDAIQQNVKAAYDVFSAYADEEEMKHLYRVVNDPIAVRVLAKINKELQEDPGLNAGAMVSGESLDEPMKAGGPYWDATHPQHQRTKEKVAAHFTAKTRADARKRA